MTRSFSLLAELVASGVVTKKVAGMDKPVLNLAATIAEAQTALAGIPAVVGRLKTAAVSVAGKVDMVNALCSDLEGADLMLEHAVSGALAPKGNGPPADPTPPAGSAPSSTDSTDSPNSSQSSPNIERTAIGPVAR